MGSGAVEIPAVLHLRLQLLLMELLQMVLLGLQLLLLRLQLMLITSFNSQLIIFEIYCNSCVFAFCILHCDVLLQYLGAVAIQA